MDRALTSIGRRAFLGALVASAPAYALGRTPYGGTLRMRLPLNLSALDPHVLDDPASALFASAIADPLYALDASGAPYPTLAAALPEPTAAGARIELRHDLRTARGKPLSAMDVIFSLERTRALGGAAVLGALARPQRDSRDALAVVFPDTDPRSLARALASPLTAILPRGFSRLTPDGTGAFVATPGATALTLLRNEGAARGPAFLDGIEVTRAAGLADALRAFESGAADIGWLGNGLYRPRVNTVPFQGPAYGFFVLRTGQTTQAWGAPGIARQLVSALPAAALARFGLRVFSRSKDAVRWGGGPCELIVSDDSPQAVELARAIEPLLSAPNNEISVSVISRALFLEARKTRRFTLMLDFVRKPSEDPIDAAQALRSAIDPALARHPPQAHTSLDELTRDLPLGILGEAQAQGACVPTFEGLDTWQLGAVWQRPSNSP